MKILVTGSSGTIGTRLCERLLADGHDVVGADWVENKWQPGVQAVTINADLRDPEQVKKLPTDVEAVIHLAANARVHDLVIDPDRALDNVKDTYNMLEFCRKNGIKKFFFASSRETYGNIPAQDSYTEDMARMENCASPYTASKIAGEAFVESYTRCYGVDHIIIRFSNVYGMYDESDRVVPLFFRKCKKNEPLTVFGEKCLDFTYIDDAVDGIVKALMNFDAAKNATYNLAYGQGSTITALAELMKQLLGATGEVTVTQMRTGEIGRYIANIDKARKAFGYDPKTPFVEGVKKSVEWYSAHT